MMNSMLSREDLAKLVLGEDEFARLGREAAFRKLCTWTLDDYRNLPLAVRRMFFPDAAFAGDGK